LPPSKNFPPSAAKFAPVYLSRGRIERGKIDVKSIAEWQGKRDGGVLSEKTYSQSRCSTSQRREIMTAAEPDNVVPMNEGAT